MITSLIGSKFILYFMCQWTFGFVYSLQTWRCAEGSGHNSVGLLQHDVCQCFSWIFWWSCHSRSRTSTLLDTVEPRMNFGCLLWVVNTESGTEEKVLQRGDRQRALPQQWGLEGKLAFRTTALETAETIWGSCPCDGVTYWFLVCSNLFCLCLLLTLLHSRPFTQIQAVNFFFGF